MISLRGIGKQFPETYDFKTWIRHRGRVPQRRVLTDISLEVNSGEIFGLLGANGAGKTTLLKLLATLVLPTEGAITIDGLNVVSDADRVRQIIGYSSSFERSFYYRLTALENLKFFGALLSLRPQELKQQIQSAVAIVDLQREMNRRYSALSTGMRQRLTLARCLLGNPRVLLVDEPTRAVDPLQSQRLRTLLREELAIRQGKTIIIATNSLDEAWEICDRVALLSQGRIITIGKPNELREGLDYPQRYRVVVDRFNESLRARLVQVPGLELTDTLAVEAETSLQIKIRAPDINGLLQALNANGIHVKKIETIHPATSEVFSELIRENST
ncbi:MAG: daunorubicin resistance protein DrrA family ABC transporter ATP-binding protein [Burkholderiaceae bacterium]